MQKASLMAQMVKNLPAMQEIRVQSLGQENPLEKEMATHSSILAWKIPWTEAPGKNTGVGSHLLHLQTSNSNISLILKLIFSHL